MNSISTTAIYVSPEVAFYAIRNTTVSERKQAAVREERLGPIEAYVKGVTVIVR